MLGQDVRRWKLTTRWKKRSGVEGDQNFISQRARECEVVGGVLYLAVSVGGGVPELRLGRVGHSCRPSANLSLCFAQSEKPREEWGKFAGHGFEIFGLSVS
jgi:hypothetical protein